jgi:hypothetical protein
MVNRSAVAQADRHAIEHSAARQFDGRPVLPPGSSQFYFDRLPGEKYLRYVRNADHALKGSGTGRHIVAQALPA